MSRPAIRSVPAKLDAADNLVARIPAMSRNKALCAPMVRGEPMAFRIGAEIREQHVFLGVLRDLEPAFLPKRSNSGMAAWLVRTCSYHRSYMWRSQLISSLPSV